MQSVVGDPVFKAPHYWHCVITSSVTWILDSLEIAVPFQDILGGIHQWLEPFNSQYTRGWLDDKQFEDKSCEPSGQSPALEGEIVFLKKFSSECTSFRPVFNLTRWLFYFFHVFWVQQSFGAAGAFKRQPQFPSSTVQSHEATGEMLFILQRLSLADITKIYLTLIPLENQVGWPLG